MAISGNVCIFIADYSVIAVIQNILIVQNSLIIQYFGICQTL